MKQSRHVGVVTLISFWLEGGKRIWTGANRARGEGQRKPGCDSSKETGMAVTMREWAGADRIHGSTGLYRMEFCAGRQSLSDEAELGKEASAMQE